MHEVQIVGIAKLTWVSYAHAHNSLRSILQSETLCFLLFKLTSSLCIKVDVVNKFMFIKNNIKIFDRCLKVFKQ